MKDLCGRGVQSADNVALTSSMHLVKPVVVLRKDSTGVIPFDLEWL